MCLEGTPSNINKYIIKNLCTKNGAFIRSVTIILLSHLTIGNNLMNGYNVVFDHPNMRLGFGTTTCELRDHTESWDQPIITNPQPRSMYRVILCIM